MSALSCLSCAHHRPERCAKGMAGWPEAKLEWCPMACFEPGSDEREDWDMAAIEASLPDSAPESREITQEFHHA